MKKWLSVLLLLISSITITGFSFVDNMIVSKVLAIIFTATFFIVGILYNINLLNNKNDGSKAFVVIAIILILLCFVIYLGVINLKEWIVGWPKYVKIIVSGLLIALTILVAALRINNYVKQDIN